MGPGPWPELPSLGADYTGIQRRLETERNSSSWQHTDPDDTEVDPDDTEVDPDDTEINPDDTQLELPPVPSWMVLSDCYDDSVRAVEKHATVNATVRVTEVNPVNVSDVNPDKSWELTLYFLLLLCGWCSAIAAMIRCVLWRNMQL